jgi:hypothetical protein
MNYGRAFSFVTEDPDWIKKIVIGGLVMLIPIVGTLALMGWGLEINRRIITGESELLPEWSEFGALIMAGLKELVVVLVYMLPVIIISACGGVSLGVIGTLGSDSIDSSTAATLITGSTVCMYCFVFLFAIIGGLLLSPATSVLAETGEIGAALQVGRVFGIFRAAMGPYIIALLLVGLASSVASSIGSIACGIGALIATAYMLPVRHHMLAQAYKIAKANQAETSM